MERETRILTAPNKSWFKSRQWCWEVQRRNYNWWQGTPDDEPQKVAGIWYMEAYGYARNASAAEDKARLWLAEEALTQRIAEEMQQAEIERVKQQVERTTITYVEEN